MESSNADNFRINMEWNNVHILLNGKPVESTPTYFQFEPYKHIDENIPKDLAGYILAEGGVKIAFDFNYNVVTDRHPITLELLDTE